MAEAVADLDGVPVGVGSRVGSRLRRDAGVPVAVRLAVGDQPVVVGERVDPVLVVPAPDHVVDRDAVGLHHEHAGRRGVLDREVAQVQPGGAVSPDRHHLLVLGVDHHIGRLDPGPLDLQVALALDGDEVLQVGALLLLVPGEDLVAERRHRRREVRARRRGRGEAGRLPVHTRQDLDDRVGLGRRGHRGLHRVVAALLTLRPHRGVGRARVGRKAAGDLMERDKVTPADQEFWTRACRAGAAVLGNLALSGQRRRCPVVVCGRARCGPEEQPDEGDCGRDEDAGHSPHAGEA